MINLNLYLSWDLEILDLMIQKDSILRNYVRRKSWNISIHYIYNILHIKTLQRMEWNLQFLFAHFSSFIHNEYYILISNLLLQAISSNYNNKSGVFLPLGE